MKKGTIALLLLAICGAVALVYGCQRGPARQNTQNGPGNLPNSFTGTVVSTNGERGSQCEFVVEPDRWFAESKRAESPCTVHANDNTAEQCAEVAVGDVVYVGYFDDQLSDDGHSVWPMSVGKWQEDVFAEASSSAEQSPQAGSVSDDVS